MIVYEAIIDNIDYLYPSCGGIAVDTNGVNFRIRKESNYSGRTTGRVVSVPCGNVLMSYEMAQELVNDTDFLRQCGGRVIRKGYIVQ